MISNIITFNIKASNAPSETRSFIDELTAPYKNAVICLQEVDIGARRSGGINVHRYLADGKDSFFTQSISFDSDNEVPTKKPMGMQGDWHYGLSTISTHQIKSLHHISLGPDEKTFWDESNKKGTLVWEYEPRVANMVQIDCDGKDVWVINTHLAHKSDRSLPSPVRLEQVKALSHAINKIVPSGSATFVAGDFNATLNNPDLAILRDQFKVASCGQATYDNRKGTKEEIDFIFNRNASIVTPPFAIKKGFSDHKAVMVSFVP